MGRNSPLHLRSSVAAVVGGGGDSHAAQFVGVILAIEDVPLFAAFEDFFFLRRDALADFGVGFLFVLQRRRKDLHDLLADGVAVFNKFYFVAGDKHIGNLMRQANHFFASESHARYTGLENSAVLPNAIGTRAISKESIELIGSRPFREALTAAPACGRAPVAPSPSCTSPGRRRRCGAFRPDAARGSRALRHSSGLRWSVLPSCAAERAASPLPAPCSRSGFLR